MTVFTSGQDLYDFIAKSVYEQGKPSMVDGNCAYRSDEGGLKCAAGMLIDDEHFKPLLNIDTTVEDEAVWRGMILKSHPELANIREAADIVEMCQSAHDDAAFNYLTSGKDAFKKQFMINMDDVAKSCKLKPWSPEEGKGNGQT